LICNIPKKNWERDSLPAVEDEITLVPIDRIYNRESTQLTHVEQGELGVHNRSSDGRQDINVWISSESEYPLFLSRLESVCIAKGWFSNTDEKVFTLTDGSSWVKNSKIEQVRFSEGDRVIICWYKGNKYLLINLDKNFYFNKEGKQFERRAYQIVEPFNFKQDK